MLYPKLFGQSGTAIPAPWLVTSPPLQIKTTTLAATKIAYQCSNRFGKERSAIKTFSGA
jgi:hypothetical protein